MRQLADLRREDGIALVMALVFMAVLLTVSGTLVYYSTSNTTSASFQAANEKAFSAAEAGLNEGIAVVANAANPTLSTTLPSSLATAIVDTTTYPGATIRYWGTYIPGTSTWTVYGKGTATAAKSTSRTVSQQLLVSAGSGGGPWRDLYSDGGDGCTTLTSNVVIYPPLYVKGPLCIQQNVIINSPTLQVNGTLTMLDNARVGSPGANIGTANISGGCSRTSGGPYAKPCTVSQQVYANTITTNTGTMSKPAVDLPYWYQNAAPGPKHGCTTGSVPGGFDTNSALDRSRSTFTLTNGSSYSCTVTSGGTTVGKLIWNASTQVLQISGTIFFDGNIYLTSGTYQGQGTIYTSGTLSIDGNSHFCGVAACDDTWNPDANLIVFVAGSSTDTYGFTMTQNSIYQAATYVVNDYQQIQNSQNWGPVIARSLDIQNNAHSIKQVNILPAGAPGAFLGVTVLPRTWSG